MLDEQEIHNMQSGIRHDGKEWLHCPECGRTVLIEWEPFSRIVVVDGNEIVVHRYNLNAQFGSVSVEAT